MRKGAGRGAKSRRWQGVPDLGGKRPSVYLGRCTAAEYAIATDHLRRLQHARRLGMAVQPAEVAWLAEIDQTLHQRVVRAGLAMARQGQCEAITLAEHVADYIARRTDLGERARRNLRQAEAKLVEHFGSARTMDSVTVGDAKAFRQWLEGQKYALATISMHIKKARQFFADAVDRELLTRNVFAKVKAGSQVNAARVRYVPTADVEAVMARASGQACRPGQSLYKTCGSAARRIGRTPTASRSRASGPATLQTWR